MHAAAAPRRCATPPPVTARIRTLSSPHSSTESLNGADISAPTTPIALYTLVRRFIKTGIFFLFLGLALGAWLLVRRELFAVWPHPHLVSAHAHAVFVGFVMFLIFGVALWLFPRAARDDTRYSPTRVAIAYWVLTIATAARFFAEAARAWSDAAPLRWIVVLGGLGQVLGAAIYFWAMWSRIRPVGSALREAQGERF